MPSVKIIECAVVCQDGTMSFAMSPPLWQSAQVLTPTYVPAVTVKVTLVLPWLCGDRGGHKLYWPFYVRMQQKRLAT